MIRVSNKWTDDENDLKSRLRSYRALVIEYQACKALYDTLFPSCTARLSDMPKAQSDGYEPERWADKRMTQSERMARSLEDMQRAYLDIEDLMNGLDGDQRAVIIRKYMLNETWDKIADELHCCEKTARTWHDKGIRVMVKSTSHYQIK
jgi:DNA-directed RNA polymerase specialized sigma24 family protein